MEGFIEILKAIIFGVVEGITEWLPISSTGHLILLNEIMPLNVSEEFWELFEVVIQLGAIMAVIILFFNKLWPFKFRKNENEGIIKKDVISIWVKVFIACIPAAIIGFLLDDWIDEHFFNYITVSITLILYGILFIAIELLHKNKVFKNETVMDISYNMALLIGIFQLLALIPGTSRSGVTILGAMILGCSRTASAEFSFYLSIPIMFGASILKGAKYFINYGMPQISELIILLVGMIIAFVVSMACIKALMSFIKKHDFKIFGIYRIILGIVIIIFFLLR